MQNGCIRAKVVVCGQNGSIRTNVVVFGLKVVVFRQKGCFGQIRSIPEG